MKHAEISHGKKQVMLKEMWTEKTIREFCLQQKQSKK